MKFAFPATLGPIMIEFAIEPSVGVTLHLTAAYESHTIIPKLFMFFTNFVQ